MRPLLMLLVCVGALYSFSALAGWEKKCQTDEMTDKTACSVVYDKWTEDDDVLVMIIDKEIASVYYPKLYPNEPVRIRIDKNTMHESMLQPSDMAFFAEVPKIIQEFKEGNSLKVQYQHWPSGVTKTISIPLSGFTKAYEKLE